MAAVEGVESHATSWPSSQFDEIMWNGLGDYEPLENLASRTGLNMDTNAFTVVGSPECQLSSEAPQLDGSLRIQSSGNSTHSGIGNQYMGSTAWDNFNASDLTSVLVNAFPCERTSIVEASGDDYLLYNGNEYLLQSEKNIGSSVDFCIVNYLNSEDYELPATNASSEFTDTKHMAASRDSCMLQSVHQDIEERESSSNCTLHQRNHLEQPNIQHHFVGRPANRVAQHPFMDSKPCRTKKKEVNCETNRGQPVASKIQFYSSMDSWNHHKGFNKQTGPMNISNASVEKDTQINQSIRKQDQMPARFQLARRKSRCLNGELNNNGTPYNAQSSHRRFQGLPSHNKSKPAREAQTNQGQGLRVKNKRDEPYTRMYFQGFPSFPEQSSVCHIHQGKTEVSQSPSIKSGQCTQPIFKGILPMAIGMTSRSTCSKRLEHCDLLYPQHQQLRMMLDMGSRSYDQRKNASSPHHQCQYECTRGIGMDLMAQIDEDSVEANVLQQLESTINDMAVTKRNIIRDSFYRLANGAKGRQVEAENIRNGNYDSPCTFASLKLGEETHTNALDRWMVHLLFHKATKSATTNTNTKDMSGKRT